MDDTDDDIQVSPYDDGYWEWDDANGRLEFRKNFLSQGVSNETIPPAQIAGTLQFNDEPDLFEQLKFQKRFQRRTIEDDVVTLQDVKDVTLYTAPAALVTTDIIYIFHKPAMDRFLRALIFYCQYFLQVSDELNHRSIDAKIKTPNSERIVKEFRDNLQDLRLIVAKEHSSISLGGEGFQAYHHMGTRKQHSMSDKAAILFEKMIRLSIHIVWIALGRVSMVEIEVEVNRLFKSDWFNFAEHKYKYQAAMTPDDRSLVLGQCLQNKAMLRTTSPLLNELLCHRDDRVLDPGLLGLGVLKQPNLCTRLKYLERVLILPEEEFQVANVTVGILGMSRVLFDAMLKLIKERRTSRSTPVSSVVMAKRASRVSTVSNISTKLGTKLYADIVLPERRLETKFDDDFPEELYPSRPINKFHRKKWLNRAMRRSAMQLSGRRD